MSVIFDNPAGAFALLGVPVVLGIHMLQARSRKTHASTLFLLDRLAPESRGGLRLERLRRSLPLALRLLAVLVLTWLLTMPRFVRPDSTLRVAVVLDSSLSMDASRERLLAELPGRLSRLAAFSAGTEYLVTESDTRRPVVYHGLDAAELRLALSRWRPALGTHDPAPALAQASLSVREAGVVVYVTDTPESRPGGAATLAYGRALDNCGFAGSTVEVTDAGVEWRALVRNYGKSPRTLSWSVRAGGTDSPASPLSLKAGETAPIGGVMPAGVDRLVVNLSPDTFAADDALPIMRPSPRRIRVCNALDGEDAKVVARVLAGIPAVEVVPAGSPCDLRYARLDAPDVAPGTPAVLFAAPGKAPRELSGAVLAESHPYTADAGWQGLVAPRGAGAVSPSSDAPLVWRGATPVVALRASVPGKPTLVVDFAPQDTNAAKLPAFVVLLRRHLESLREKLPVAYAVNTDTHRLLPVAHDAKSGPLSVRVGDGEPEALGALDAAVFRAPDRPAFFTVLQAGKPLVTGAAQFGDVREADFSACGESDTLTAREKALAHAASVPDPWRPLWLVALAALLLGAWYAQRERR